MEGRNAAVREAESANKELQRRIRGQEEVKRICEQQQSKLEEVEQRIRDNQKAYQDKIKSMVAGMGRLEG